jgi:hypothetical protein
LITVSGLTMNVFESRCVYGVVKLKQLLLFFTKHSSIDCSYDTLMM